ncbi:MAG: hypothetical protein JSS75_07280 [Bacteroidetes bacterium]|nr:hypothetical protein [Bacteroidota bacterium]
MTNDEKHLQEAEQLHSVLSNKITILDLKCDWQEWYGEIAAWLRNRDQERDANISKAINKERDFLDHPANVSVRAFGRAMLTRIESILRKENPNA